MHVMVQSPQPTPTGRIAQCGRVSPAGSVTSVTTGAAGMRDGNGSASAIFSTSSIVDTMCTSSVSITFFGMSARSFSLSRGRMMFVTPARWAARIFSLTPPIGSTLPRSVISPVMATSRRVGILVSADTSVVAMVMPADGPSFGMAPSGTCTWMSIFEWKSSGRFKSAALDRT